MWLYLPSWSLLSFFSARYKCISNETKLNPKKQGRTRKLVWLDTQQPALKSQPDLCESVLSLFHLCKTSQFLYSDSTWVPLWVGTSCRAQTPVEPQYEVACVLKLERRIAYKTSLAQVSASGRLWEYHESCFFCSLSSWCHQTETHLLGQDSLEYTHWGQSHMLGWAFSLPIMQRSYLLRNL